MKYTVMSMKNCKTKSAFSMYKNCIIIEQHKTNLQANKNTTLNSHHNKRCFDQRPGIKTHTGESMAAIYIDRVISLPGPKMIKPKYQQTTQISTLGQLPVQW